MPGGLAHVFELDGGGKTHSIVALNRSILDDGDEYVKKAGLGLCLCELLFCRFAVDWVECLCEEVAYELYMLGTRCA